MATELKVPVLPESVSDATIADWHKKVGDAVSRDENLVDLETDKVVLEVPSPVDGVIKEIKFESGDTVESEQVLAIIEEGAAAPAPSSDAKEDDKEDDKKEAPAAGKQDKTSGEKASSGADAGLSPAARRYADEEGIDASRVEGTGRNGQVTKEDLVNFKKSGASQSKSAPAPAPAAAPAAAAGSRPEERVPMTRIRKRIAERLMQSKDSIAMLTSF